jgi:hypothetical protein
MLGQFLTHKATGAAITMATTLQVLERLRQTGHLEYPFGKHRPFTRAFTECSLTDPDVALSIASYQDFESVALDALSLKHHGRAAMHDGDVGPATMELFDLDRCWVPDYGPGVAAAVASEAVGAGPWKSCHGIGDYHCAIVIVDERNMPAHLKQSYGSGTAWKEVLRRAQLAYVERGLLFIFVNEQRVDYLTGQKVEGPVQTHLSFVTSSNGWIGLAIVGPASMTCSSSPIWLRLLATFTGGTSIEAVITQWTSLVKHELGHNCGLGHSRGGVMNASIVSNLPTSWSGDPSQSILDRLFGGKAVQGGPAGDPDGPTPVPGDKIWTTPFDLKQGDKTLGRFILAPATQV